MYVYLSFKNNNETIGFTKNEFEWSPKNHEHTYLFEKYIYFMIVLVFIYDSRIMW